MGGYVDMTGSGTHTHTDIYVYTVYTYTQRIVLESVDQKLGEGKAAGLWLD